MPVKPLALVKRQHATAFEGFVAWLKQDVALKRVVKVWRAWEGNDDDGTPPTVDDEVTVVVTPSLGPAAPVAFNGGVRVWSRPLDITIEVAIGASKAVDGMNLADAFSARIEPQDDPSRAAFDAKLASWSVMEAIEVQPLDATAESTSELTMLVGKYRLEMWI